jgi:hypothetical protein
MGRRRHWNWFSGIAVVLGVAACSNDKATATGGANACSLVEGDSGSVLQCGTGNNLSLAGLLVNASREPAGAHCQNGGVRLQIGRDDNGNGTLESSEVDTTQYACGGESPDGGGAGSLIKLTDEAPGAHCSNGGQKVESGLDTNGDGQLQASEVSASEYVCNGMTGAPGDAGVSGNTSLISVADEPPGTDCPAGGQQVKFGLDDNRDGVLDSTEVDSTQYVCNGIEGPRGPQGPMGDAGITSLINVTVEPPGANCQWGGQKIEWGLDDNRDGILEGPMVPVTPMLDGGDAAVDAAPPPPPPPADAAVGDAAASDASVVDAGPVDTGEIDGTSYVCNGAPGVDSLVNIVDEPAGNWWTGYGGCYPEDGKRVQWGMDDNRDGVLDPAEVDNSQVVCNGKTVTINHYCYWDSTYIWFYHSWYDYGYYAGWNCTPTTPPG